MPDLLETIWPAAAGFIVALAASVLLVLTRRWHIAVTFDPTKGPQKFHDTLTPRIGGVAVFAGFWVAAGMAPQPVRPLLFALGLSAIATFVAGLVEDLIKQVSCALRFCASMLSGLIFCILTGYSVTRLEIAFIDDLMSIQAVSIAFTVLAVSGLTHAVNIIDGFHGLATGSVIIMLSAFAVVAWSVGDYELAMLATVVIAVLLGFLVVNFPYGHIFLGDGGAYFTGFVLAAMAVMLPMRNPDVSAWVSIVILAYPVVETMYAIFRKTIRPGHQPTKPDRVHLHMLLYRKITRAVKSKRLANPTTSVLLWGGAMTGLVFVMLSPYERGWSLLAFALQIVLYAVVYRRVALLRRLSVPRLRKKGSGRVRRSSPDVESPPGRYLPDGLGAGGVDSREVTASHSSAGD